LLELLRRRHRMDQPKVAELNSQLEEIPQMLSG
jgi:hypothetical protein